MNRKQLKPITQDDLVPRIYDWTKVSHFAITENGILVRYDGHLEDGFPIYMCLYEGWWEIKDACAEVDIRDVLEAEPVNLKVARAIIRKEAKPRCQRPKERNSWVCPY